MADHSLLETANLPDAEPVVAEKTASATRLADACRPHPEPNGAERETAWRELIATAREIGSRAPDVTEEELTEMIDEAIRAVRSQRR